MIKVKRALLSVSDKTGLVPFAKGLHALGIEILSTGGTARQLKTAGIPVIEVSEYTGFPEMLDGRVKTLHPKIHAGLLAMRDNNQHIEQLTRHHIGLIDMVVVNLYPFEHVISKKNVSFEEAIENIDIGGPTMLRAAAKNFKHVAVICNPSKYPEIFKELDNNSGILADSVLFQLAVETFAHTARYDGIISDYLIRRLRNDRLGGLPSDLTLKFSKIQDLRYGENPHQKGAFYRDSDKAYGLANIQQLHGKELSFNNLLDLNAAVDVVKDLSEPAAVIIKHNNPTGIAENKILSVAYTEAYNCDKLSAFGGIIGFNREVDLKTAQAISKSGFMECIIAPNYDQKAFALLSQKKNVRILRCELDQFGGVSYDFKMVTGGVLLQDKDNYVVNPSEWKVVTKKKPTKAQMETMIFGWKIIKNIKSNAMILVKGHKTVGIGCGQTSRVESAQTAITKASKNAKNSILVSDAFLPKIDNVQLCAKAGISAIIQTGGSVADEEVIKYADKAKIAMVMTGMRHFKH